MNYPEKFWFHPYGNLIVTKILFFITNKKDVENKYEFINECIKIEAIDKPINDIISKIKELKFREKKNINANYKEIFELKPNVNLEIKSKDFKTKGNLYIINKRKSICKLISKNIKLRSLLKVEMWFLWIN